MNLTCIFQKCDVLGSKSLILKNGSFVKPPSNLYKFTNAHVFFSVSFSQENGGLQPLRDGEI